MAFRKKGFSAKQSRRMSRKMDSSMVGSHVQRGSHSRRAANASSVSFSNARAGARASGSQLDTLAPATTSGEDRAAYRQRVQRRQYIEGVQRKARIRRIVVALVAVVLVVGLAAGAGFMALRGTVGSEMALKNSDAADALVAVGSDSPYYVLATAELGAVAYPLELSGPDLIVLARVDDAAHTMSLVNIPASLQVTVDGATSRLAEAALRGDASLVTAVSNFAKVDISHYVKLGQGDMEGLVDGLGGIDVNVSQVVDDPRAGDVYIPAGQQTLDGRAALTYLRATNLKLGVEDQLANQASFAALLIGAVYSGDGAFVQRVEAVDSHFQTDMSLADLEVTQRWMQDVGAAGITTKVLPGYMTVTSDVVESGASYYIGSSNDMAAIIASFEGDQSAQTEQEASSQAAAQPVDVGSFTVEVQNGTDIAGAASVTAETLSGQGFNVAKTGNAEQQVYNETLVVYNTAKVTNTSRSTDESQDEQDEEGLEDEEGIDESGEGEESDEEAVEGEEDQAVQQQPQTEMTDAEREAANARGLARANEVIAALGMGRAVEAGAYYDFDTDVLVIIGYDYKPTS